MLVVNLETVVMMGIKDAPLGRLAVVEVLEPEPERLTDAGLDVETGDLLDDSEVSTFQPLKSVASSLSELELETGCFAASVPPVGGDPEDVNARVG